MLLAPQRLRFYLNPPRRHFVPVEPRAGSVEELNKFYRTYYNVHTLVKHFL